MKSPPFLFTRKLLTRLFVFMLVAVLPVAQFVAAGCERPDEGHHRESLSLPGAGSLHGHRTAHAHGTAHVGAGHDHGNTHDHDEHRGDGSQRSTTCPIAVSCTMAAQLTVAISGIPQLLEGEPRVFEAVPSPTGIDHSTPAPPPRHSA